LKLTRKDKAKAVLLTLENTALYMALGFAVGLLIPPSVLVYFVALMVLLFAVEVAYPKIVPRVSFQDITDDELFLLLLETVPKAFLNFMVGYLLGYLVS